MMMKYIVFLLLTLTCIAGETQPHADEGEQLYRCLVPGVGWGKKLGGLYQKCQPPKQLIKSQKDIELYYQKKMADMKLEHEKALMDVDTQKNKEKAEAKAKAMKWGNIFLFGGLALFVVGVIMAGVLKQYKLEFIGNIMWPLGAGAVAVGAIWIEAVDHYDAVVWTIVGLVVVGVIVYFAHGKGVELKWPWKKNDDKDTKEVPNEETNEVS